MFLESVIIAFLAYLLFSLVIAIIGNMNYRAILCSKYQWIGVIFVYWWVPIPRMIDLDNKR